MEITLSPSLLRFVEEKVASGEYASVSDVVNDALVRLRGDAAPEWTPDGLREAVRIGIDQADRGEFVEFTAEDVIADGRKLLEAERAGRVAGSEH